MAKLLGCPRCKNYNTPEFWDKQTKEVEQIGENDAYTSASEPLPVHQELDTFYRCPICNETVNGVDLLREGQD